MLLRLKVRVHVLSHQTAYDGAMATVFELRVDLGHQVVSKQCMDQYQNVPMALVVGLRVARHL